MLTFMLKSALFNDSKDSSVLAPVSIRVFSSFDTIKYELRCLRGIFGN